MRSGKFFDSLLGLVSGPDEILPSEIRVEYANDGQNFVKTATIEISAIGQLAAPAIPEPTTLAILGLGLFGLGVMRRRRTA